MLAGISDGDFIRERLHELCWDTIASIRRNHFSMVDLFVPPAPNGWDSRLPTTRPYRLADGHLVIGAPGGTDHDVATEPAGIVMKQGRCIGLTGTAGKFPKIASGELCSGQETAGTAIRVFT